MKSATRNTSANRPEPAEAKRKRLPVMPVAVLAPCTKRKATYPSKITKYATRKMVTRVVATTLKTREAYAMMSRKNERRWTREDRGRKYRATCNRKYG